MTFKLTQTRTTAGQGAAWGRAVHDRPMHDRPVHDRPMHDVRRKPAGIDVHSFQAIYDAYYAEVARWIRALGGPAADQDDLIQEVFVVVYRRLHDFEADVLPTGGLGRDWPADDEAHGASTYWRCARRARSYSSRAAWTDASVAISATGTSHQLS